MGQNVNSKLEKKSVSEVGKGNMSFSSVPPPYLDLRRSRKPSERNSSYQKLRTVNDQGHCNMGRG